MKKENIYLTSKEFELMTILWNASTPLTSSGILEASPNRSFSIRSLHALLNKLMDKDYVKVTATVTRTKTNARLYASNISLEEHMALQIAHVYQGSDIKLNLGSLLTHFTKTNKKNNIAEEAETWLKDNKKSK